MPRFELLIEDYNPEKDSPKWNQVIQQRYEGLVFAGQSSCASTGSYAMSGPYLRVSLKAASTS
jgi:hypothetical protein